MSIRAYKVKKIDVVETPTFNLWKDNLFTTYISSLLDDLGEGGGLVYFERKQVLKRFELFKRDLEELAKSHDAEEIERTNLLFKNLLTEMGDESYYLFY